MQNCQKMASKKELASDQRFSHVTKDPRFWEMPEKDHKIKIDKRFRAMFHDKKFKLKYTIDKRGRPINHSSTEDLKRFYDLSDSDSDLSGVDTKVFAGKKMKKKKLKLRGGVDSGKLLDKPTEGESKIVNQEMGHKCGAPLKSDDSQNGQKSIMRIASSCSSKLKKECKKINVEIDPTQDDKGLVWKGKNKQIVMSSDSSLSKQETSKASSTKAVKAPKTKFSLEEKKTESVNKAAIAYEQSNINKSQLDEISKNEDYFDYAISKDGGETGGEEESEDGGETGGEEESEDGGETGGEDSDGDSEEDESDSGPDLARGKGNIETSSEDEEEDDMSEIFPKEPEIEHAWRELHTDAPRADEITSRLAVCNMDWDRLKAKDLLALFNSFIPKGGVIFSVKIYPSEFGKQRLKEEELQGPVELLSLPEDATEKDWIYTEKLRDYQFKRLKYFYAVVECDSPETANKIYEECDGLEFESSCSFVDLRFIPDDVTFDDEPKDIASEVDGAAYKPKYFTSAAMGTSKVDITWDETDHERITSLHRNFKKDELLDMGFQAYLASSSEEEEEQQGGDVAHETEDDKPKKSQKDDEEQIARYRELLQSIQEKEKKREENDMEMEIKWVPGLKETAEEMVKSKLEGKDKLTPWEQFLENKKEKRKLKKKRKATAKEELNEDEFPSDVDLNDPYFAEELGKTGLKKISKKFKTEESTPEKEEEEKHKAEMALLMMDDEEDDRKHFNYEKIVEQQNLSKKKKKQLMKKEELLEDDFQVNVADTRFQALYTSHLFNLDPSDSNFKKTKAVEKILEEKARRREQKQQNLAKEIQENEIGKKGNVTKKAVDPALSMLIKSVKNKTEQFQARKKPKIK
ncbi:ESF1 homolog isoform X2 [Chelonia mydas]|uniref:ESF1 homolog isoform X2 n=1 Tax=Chelonia mydas TaxID=8469 RepID=UPI0018A1F794|nr:ESF1 homolog isoform X2 [Chelonia mydas]XP_043399941.1 ESF1 homolog isoform X2 [Chelonia mydas]XP_043399942.1 ESF1 homolog isoform X2 [Chelonia mydas]XP_043399943.1 ESF1 homolog isoform X2 [Chelonia mydas]XP_043399944.1 ESF1 homolog isoform X2 [Chelonia mydas]XP_043399945.1 ESF1 homolog isoform X2 [Chelonia mydas]XP_043399946.1 ESF1 homolog isoform X2 [Chelonia mydas]XP_043399947.1 ESF1 homolog isoform X2 [Chelonia mydas]